MYLISLCTIMILSILYMASTRMYKYEYIGNGLEGKWRIGIIPLAFVSFFLILVLTSTVRYGFIDTFAYKEMYQLSRNDLEYVNSSPYGVESGWLYICYWLNYISISPKMILFFSAFIINLAYVLIIKKYSCDPIFSLLIYFCLAYLDTNNGLRQIVAAGISILAFPLLTKEKKRNYVLYAICIILAMQLHESAVVCFFVAFIALGRPFNIKIKIALCFSVLFLLMPELLENIVGEIFSDSKYLPYLDSTVGGMSWLRAFITGVIPIIMSVFYLHRCSKLHISVYKEEALLLNYMMINSMFTIMGLNMQYWARFCFYTSFASMVLFPKLIYEVFSKKDFGKLKVTIMACYLFYFSYNIYVNIQYGALSQFFIDIPGFIGGYMP